MYGEENSYAGYDPGGLTPEELLAKINNLEGRITSTLSRVDRDGDDIRQQQSQILQDLDLIELSVTDIDSRIGAAETSISLQAGQIESKASVDYVDQSLAPIFTDLEGKEQRIASAESTITQQAGVISQKVSQTDYNGNTIASLINQTATTVKIQAARINLTGAVSVIADLSTVLADGYAGHVELDNGIIRSVNPSVLNQYTEYSYDGLQFNTGNGFGGMTMIPSGTGMLELYAGMEIVFDAPSIDFGNANISGLTVSNASYATNAGNADTLDGYHASAFSMNGHTHSQYASVNHSHSEYSLNGHEHSDTQYVKPYTTQPIKLWASGNKFRVYINGSYAEFTASSGSV